MPQLTRQIGDMAAHLAVFPRVHVIFAIQPVGGGILRDHQQLAHAIIDQLFGLAQDRMGRAADQFATHFGDDAELALVVTALGNLEIAVVARCQLHTGGGQQVHEGVRVGRHGRVDGIQNLFVLMRPRHGHDARVVFPDVVRLGSQTAGHDDLAVFD